MKRHLGELEILILLALIRLGDQAYGVSIAREIEASSGRSVALGSVYAALERLEDQKAGALVSSKLGEATPERGGRAKRFFQITPLGIERVHALRQSLTSMWQSIPAKGLHA